MKSLKRWSFAPIIQNFFNLGVFQASGIILQLLLIPIISRKYGIETFGQVALAASFAAFIASVANYGTSQTAIKDVANNLDNKEFLSELFYKILFFRLLAACILLPMMGWMFFLHTKLSYWILLGTIPLILAEVFNPLYFLIGKEKIQWLSWGSIVVKSLILLLILLIPLHQQQAAWINVILGSPMVLYYIIICILIHYKESLQVILPTKGSMLKLARENVYIMFNGTAASLQQSIFLFAIAGYVSASTLGAYALVDKLLTACRQAVASFSNAVYPHASRLFQQSPSSWFAFKLSLQKLYAAFFGITALLIFFGAKTIVLLITKKESDTTEIFVQMFCLAPLLVALNANNVLTLLLEKGYKSLFIISILILAATFIISFVLVRFSNSQALGWYPLAIEGSCLLIYLAFTQKKKLNVP